MMGTSSEASDGPAESMDFNGRKHAGGVSLTKLVSKLSEFGYLYWMKVPLKNGIAKYRFFETNPVKHGGVRYNFSETGAPYPRIHVRAIGPILVLVNFRKTV